MTSPDTLEKTRHTTVSLEKTIYTLGQMEKIPEPQIALAGRSNVGKSSLLNCMTNRKKLAKISSVPGKTRSLNYYLVQPGNFYLVDLPGYGYAKRPKSERNVWGNVMEHFFTRNKSLVGLILILDCRLPPQTMDMELVAMAQAISVPLLPVLTKADKCNQRERTVTHRAWVDVLGPDADPLFFSSKSRQGRAQLWNEIHNLVQAVTSDLEQAPTDTL
ncbi:GTP-binding protein [Desulfonatronum thiosulfatophilum]|uniref:Probable GTP-binding protein EngB n=1 Tax=Desulfonatronum thiosulfatophilum TaxID=617002 RepID=A0A1G6CU97_9BACT|nr:ribosome biogenesis GTP-binding protein YihA/YsxC [Desulfonatronum thiosulfatophilum]SDB36466.1 GTP-binding protein [Desulfonatronum thiosulfatophilum]